MTVLHLIPRDTREVGNAIAVVLMIAAFTGCIAFGFMAGSTAEAAFGCGLLLGMFGMGLAVLYWCGYGLLKGNPERFRGIGE